MRKGYLISDTHIFSSYSLKDKHWARIDAAASEAEKTKGFFVINGDMFELLYTHVPFDQRIGRAVQELEKFVDAHPGCEFHYALGNHEALKAFSDELHALAKRKNNLHVYDNAFRLGNALFVHGDEAIDKKMPLSTKRELHDDGYATKTWKMRHTVLPVFHAGQHAFRVARSIKNYPGNGEFKLLAEAWKGTEEDALRNGVTHIFYGHTHLPKKVENFQDTGISMYNSGAGVQSATFDMLELCMDGKKVCSVASAPETIGEMKTTSNAR